MPRGLRNIVNALVAGSALLLAAQAGASVTVGEDFGSGEGSGCDTPSTSLEIQTQSAGNSYAAPFDGVFTSWSASAAGWNSGTLKVARLGSGDTFTVIGQDGPRPSDGVAYPIRIPVRQGDVIGVFLSNQLGCWDRTNQIGYRLGYKATDVPAGPGAFDSQSAGYQVPVTAQIEHDVDNDGYGDETQDGCPTNASTQGSCPIPDTTPPDTVIVQGPKKKTTSKKAIFKFNSTESGSTFECSLDGAKFKLCTSPHKVKVRPGKHHFLVRARDAAGNLDTSEANWSWKRLKKKHAAH
jgi:hypothetical protein